MKNLALFAFLLSLLSINAVADRIECRRNGESRGVEMFWFQLDVENERTDKARCELQYIRMDGPQGIVKSQRCATKVIEDAKLGKIRSYVSRNIDLKIHLDQRDPYGNYPAKVWLPGVSGKYAISKVAPADYSCVGRKSDKTLLVFPRAIPQNWVVKNDSAALGQDAWVSLKIDLGTLNGIRGLVIPFHRDNFSVALEGIYAIGVNSASGIRETYGAGARSSFTVASDNDNDALLVSPGVDILFASGTPGRALAEYSSYGHVYFVSTSADITYLRQIRRNFGLELGAHLGASIAINDGSPKSEETPSLQGKIVPELGLFLGGRF